MGGLSVGGDGGGDGVGGAVVDVVLLAAACAAAVVGVVLTPTHRHNLSHVYKTSKQIRRGRNNTAHEKKK